MDAFQKPKREIPFATILLVNHVRRKAKINDEEDIRNTTMAVDRNSISIPNTSPK